MLRNTKPAGCFDLVLALLSAGFPVHAFICNMTTSTEKSTLHKSSPAIPRRPAKASRSPNSPAPPARANLSSRSATGRDCIHTSFTMRPPPRCVVRMILPWIASALIFRPVTSFTSGAGSRSSTSTLPMIRRPCWRFTCGPSIARIIIRYRILKYRWDRNLLP